MNSLIKKALSVCVVLGLIIAMGAFAVFAESASTTGIHLPENEIIVFCPITDMLGYEVDADVQSLFLIVARDCERILSFNMNPAQCENSLVAHQKAIDNILALVCEQGIDNLQDFSTVLQILQNSGDYLPVFPFGCSTGCFFTPVWVTINGGTRIPGYRCIVCGRIVIIS